MYTCINLGTHVFIIHMGFPHVVYTVKVLHSGRYVSKMTVVNTLGFRDIGIIL